MKYNFIACCLFASLLGAGCTAETEFSDTPAAGQLSVILQPAGLQGTVATTDDKRMNDVKAFRFDGGQLQEIYGPLVPGDDGRCYLNLADNRGTLYFLANASQVTALEALVPGATTLDDFLALSASTSDMTEHGLLMSGREELGSQSVSELTVAMTRSVARIDLESTDQGVEVLQISIDGLADEGYLNPQATATHPQEAATTRFDKQYNTPLSNVRETVFYLCEQQGTDIQAEVLVRFRNALHKMKASLPTTIRRNTVYTIHVYGRGGDVTMNISNGDWEQGDTSGSETQIKARVNVEDSALPANVKVNSTCDSVFIPYTENNFNLVLDAEPGATVTVDGRITGVSVQAAASRNLKPVARLAISNVHRLPGTIREYIYADVYKEQIHKGRIVLVFLPSSIQLEGSIIFDEDGICNFDRYVDGELGRLTLPDGKIATVETDNGQTPWIKLAENAGSYRILGGWKPNDPEADGRMQEARLVITDSDGSNREVYPIRRRNWGLPVVNIGGTWWCKYNLRGNVKSFDDQISIADDQAAGTGVLDRLTTCSDDELLSLMGGQYQGGNLDELSLSHNGTAFYHEGMKGSAQNWGQIPATQMAPDGYQLPTYDDYAFFVWGTNCNIGGVGTRTHQNSQGQTITVNIVEREARFLEVSYGTIAFYDFEYEGNHWTLYGLGHQWNTTDGNIAQMSIIMAITGNTSNSWYMEGYAQASRPGQNWFKFTAQNSIKTRTVRCIKSPVEYIYN
ncbi:hypothetical protein HF895_14840 [Bacteroides sp. AN502]|nr:hypothetical protein [Caecibacteroides pullorum]MDC6281613.1 hypothetical protein [Caecibacteroides pullorum]